MIRWLSAGNDMILADYPLAVLGMINFTDLDPIGIGCLVEVHNPDLQSLASSEKWILLTASLQFSNILFPN